jgi:hypothetical protein
MFCPHAKEAPNDMYHVVITDQGMFEEEAFAPTEHLTQIGQHRCELKFTRLER